MSMFQPPVTHNEQHADDVAGTPPRRAYFYRDSVTLRFRLATGAVPAGGVPARDRERRHERARTAERRRRRA
jgi:hypothetical protein